MRCVGRPQVRDHLRWCQSVESSVDDLRTGRGVVLGWAVPMLRSVETQPLTGGFVLVTGRILFYFFNKILIYAGRPKTLRPTRPSAEAASPPLKKTHTRREKLGKISKSKKGQREGIHTLVESKVRWKSWTLSQKKKTSPWIKRLLLGDFNIRWSSSKVFGLWGLTLSRDFPLNPNTFCSVNLIYAGRSKNVRNLGQHQLI